MLDPERAMDPRTLLQWSLDHIDERQNDLLRQRAEIDRQIGLLQQQRRQILDDAAVHYLGARPKRPVQP